MDEELMRLFKGEGEEQGTIKAEDLSGRITVENAEGSFEHVLKGLQDLYGPGVNAASVDPQSDEYMALFLGIEQGIVEHWKRVPGLTDADVLLAIDRLAMKPECDVGGDEVAGQVQFSLRLSLSMQDYSRKDVQRALRIISKSVARHTRDGGQRGYLEFIRQFL